MKHFKLAIVQHRTVTRNVDLNTKAAIRYIREAKAHGADFILFPECFLSAYSAPDICRTLKPVEEIEDDPDFINWYRQALTDDSPYLAQICREAERANIGVEITAFSKGKKYPQNTAWIIGRNGEILLKYSKVHTCDFGWERYLESGEAFHVCRFDDICIGVMICYDREYPESARELMLQSAELIFVPNDCRTMTPRLMELSVHAMQNMVGIAMANPPGPKAGNSCAFHPIVWRKDGEAVDNTIVVAGEDYDGIVYAEFDMQTIRSYRETEDLGQYRKPEAYRHLKCAQPQAFNLK